MHRRQSRGGKISRMRYHRSWIRCASKVSQVDINAQPAKSPEPERKLMSRLEIKEMKEMPLHTEYDLHRHYGSSSFYSVHILFRLYSRQLTASYVKPKEERGMKDEKDGQLGGSSVAGVDRKTNSTINNLMGIVRETHHAYRLKSARSDQRKLLKIEEI